MAHASAGRPRVPPFERPFVAPLRCVQLRLITLLYAASDSTLLPPVSHTKVAFSSVPWGVVMKARTRLCKHVGPDPPLPSSPQQSITKRTALPLTHLQEQNLAI
jgi:hypothetical protein